MPVRKFRNLQEMEDSLWREPGDPELGKAIDSLWKFSARIFPRQFPPGVYKYRSIEDAQRQRDLWEQKNFEDLWKRRGIDPASLS